MKIGKKMLAALLCGTLALSSVPALGAAAESAGTPYGADGYDVTVPHVVVNQVFGASDDAEVVSHSFIELYNQSEAEVSLDGWYVYYQASPDGDGKEWQSLALEGTIAAKGHFLIRCAQVDEIVAGAWLIPEGDMEWNVQLHNKGVAVALFSAQAQLGADFSGNINEKRPANYVDMLAIQGNDADKAEAETPPAYEGAVEAEQSKKKAVCRENFADTDDNAADASDLNYEDVTPADKPVQNAEGQTISAQGGEEQPEPDPAPEQPAYTVKNDGYEADAALTLQKAGGVALGTANADGGVAEIVAYSEESGKAYVVNGQESILNVFDVNEDGSFGAVEKIDVEALMKEEDASFAYGDMTSVAVSAEGTVAVALQDADYTKPGRVAVFGEGNAIAAVYTTGVQPDMVTFSEDGRYILTADEGEPRGGYGAGIADPAGSVTVIDTQAAENAARIADFAAFDAEELAAKGVLFNKIDGQIVPAETDLEPEYIAVAGGKAYVSLQEANAIAVVDVAAAKVESVLPLGFKDYSKAENAVDLDDSDGAYAPKTYANTYGVYMPDGIAVYEAGGKTYIVTANEGDAREWGDFSDEEKRTLTSADDTVTAEKVRVLDNTVKAGISADGNYLYGARSFSLFEVTDAGLTLAYDSADEFEAKTWEYLPAYYNASNDDIELESRTAKKGIEPEAVAVRSLGGRAYAFVALERIGGIMVYDITDPSAPAFVNYVNSRDFNGELTGDVAPEGLAFAQKGEDVYLLAAFEVSGTVASYKLTAEEAPAPGGDTPDEEQKPDDTPDEEQKPDDTPAPAPGGEEESSGGCGSSVAAASLAGAAALIAGAALFLRKKRA